MQNNHNIIISQGPVCLKGSVRISGSKNASLPLLAATVLFKNKVVFTNLPHLDDIGTLAALLSSIGSQVEWINDGLTLEHKDKHSLYLDPNMANKIRGSILLLGPILARYGEIRLPMPGGCPIGKRPIDFHIHALEQLGATFIVEEHQIYGVAPAGLKGAYIRFPKPTVTGTENLIMAACLASGITVLENCACDNEIDELIKFLKSGGVSIERNHTTIIIEGKNQFLEAQSPFKIASDRMEAGSLLAACAMTEGHIELKYESCPGLDVVLEHLTDMGMDFSTTPHGLRALVNKPLRARSFITEPHPGFPTDLQAPFMALNCVSHGFSMIEERIWENRFFHAEEFLKMGAQLSIQGSQVSCHGHRTLQGALLTAQDLRGSCALLLMSLVAKGTTIIQKNHHLDRGYEFFINKINMLGGKISRQWCNDKELSEYGIKRSSLVA